MAEVLQPRDEDQVRDAVAWAAAKEVPLEVVGAGSKRGLGRPAAAAATLDLSGLAEIRDYEPQELVLSAGAATPLKEIEAALAPCRQELAFEPPDYGPLLGGAAGAQTLGGVLACNLSGPRRIKAGAARDHFLGVRAVSGRGEAFKAGGRVVKNVTGYDICKLLAGSYGTLAAMTEVTVKVLPAADKLRTVLVYGLDDAAAIAAMTAALGGPYEVTGAAHLPAVAARGSAVDYVAGAGRAVTALRVEGPAPSVAARTDGLRRMLADRGPVEELHSKNTRTFWHEVRDLAAFVADAGETVWRLTVPPSRGAAVVAALAGGAAAGRHLFDWGGGLVWLACPPADDGGAAAIHAAAAEAGGHAVLIRAPAAVRARVAVFRPQAPALAALTARVKRSFDPLGILNPGRMYAGV